MNESQMAIWIAENLSDRITRKGSGNWRLDGRITAVPEIWTALIWPRVESGEVKLSFPQNHRNMYLVFGKIGFAKARLSEDAKAGVGEL